MPNNILQSSKDSICYGCKYVSSGNTKSINNPMYKRNLSHPSKHTRATYEHNNGTRKIKSQDH